jgi:hypothetical protein
MPDRSSSHVSVAASLAISKSPCRNNKARSLFLAVVESSLLLPPIFFFGLGFVALPHHFSSLRAARALKKSRSLLFHLLPTLHFGAFR